MQENLQRSHRRPSRLVSICCIDDTSHTAARCVGFSVVAPGHLNSNPRSKLASHVFFFPSPAEYSGSFCRAIYMGGFCQPWSCHVSASPCDSGRRSVAGIGHPSSLPHALSSKAALLAPCPSGNGARLSGTRRMAGMSC